VRVSLTFVSVQWPNDAADVVEFLVANEWPFHGITRLTREQAASVSISGDDVVSFWVRVDGRVVGLLRVFDLSDLGVGSPLLDIRLAEDARGQGVGTAAVRWLTSHLFETYLELMRVEATTRHDNTAMQSVFDRCGYRQEGRLVEAWVSADGSRSDTLIYAILRREWQHAAHR
jgi:RimJ/RimL family protein N-acetyltransferase